MRVLAIDTALEACATAVFDSDHGAILAAESVAMGRGHAEYLMPQLARLMDAAGLEFAELDRIGVTTGPGSFTGLRVGIAAARGLALAAGKRAVGVSTLAALAGPHLAKRDGRVVVVALDARHDQLYLQIFGADGQSLSAPAVSRPNEAAHSAAAAAATRPAIIVGSGAERVAAAWPAGPPRPAIDRCGAPDISWVARLAAAATTARTLPKPLYLRGPDARPQDAARLLRK
jgi:tRNA threonylcarbamoyl adenosine modification protein YeaZ